jgi:hypothetical protein
MNINLIEELHLLYMTSAIENVITLTLQTHEKGFK